MNDKDSGAALESSSGDSSWSRIRSKADFLTPAVLAELRVKDEQLLALARSPMEEISMGRLVASLIEICFSANLDLERATSDPAKFRADGELALRKTSNWTLSERRRPALDLLVEIAPLVQALQSTYDGAIPDFGRPLYPSLLGQPWSASRWPNHVDKYIELWKDERALPTLDREAVTAGLRDKLRETLALLDSDRGAGNAFYHQFKSELSIAYTLREPLSIESAARTLRLFEGRRGVVKNRLARLEIDDDVSAEFFTFLYDTADELLRIPAVHEKMMHGYIRLQNWPGNPHLRKPLVSGVDIPWLEIPQGEKRIGEMLRNIIRLREADRRAELGLPEVGGFWVGEMTLYSRVKQLAGSATVIFQGQPSWLGTQSLDIWLPELQLAFEYNGRQHYEPVAFFGGVEAFKANQERDRRKHELCEANGVQLVSVRYDTSISDEEILAIVLARQQAT